MTKNNPSIIGMFVIGGATLLMIAIALLSNNDLFTPKRHFVIYFQHSVTGLNIGAPVRFRGIPVGQVTQIDGVYNPETGNMIPRIIIEFLPETLENAVVQKDEYTLFPALLANGLRASLKSTSLLTGQLYVALDFQPDTPERYMGDGDEKYPEMPSVDSGIDEAIAKFSALPLEEVVARASAALAAAEELMRNPDIAQILENAPALVAHADDAVVGIERFVRDDLTAVTDEARRTLQTTRKSVDELADAISGETLARLNTSLDTLDQTLSLAQRRLDPEDPLTIELLAALRDIRNAARSIRTMADTIEDQPEALLRGKSRQ